MSGQHGRSGGTHGLSLRGRLLVLQIAVTALFLFILGLVSTFVFYRHFYDQFRALVLAQSTRTPEYISQHPDGLAAVQIYYDSYNPEPLTPDTAATRELVRQLQAFTPQQIKHLVTASSNHQGVFSVSAPEAPQLLATARRISSFGQPGALVVAVRVSVLTNQLRGLVLVELATGAALLVLLGIGGQWLIGRGLDPLARMASTANEITERGDLTARMAQADEQSEVGRLGAAINTMLTRIQQAFIARLRSEQKVREFAADASHELRTPLTTIRGYAELYGQGALGPDQLPSAMRRIEQEAKRMSVLVAELLELARLDRTSSLDLTETDLALVVRDAVADALAVEPGRTIIAEAPPRLLAVVDEPRIRQVLANLLANVRAHTPVIAPVAVRLGAVTGGVLIEVADGGPGMSLDDASRAFNRFYRADGRDSAVADRAEHSQEYSAGGGSGLGLSIVQAIAAAHGGQATLESWLGGGTRVRIWLPTPDALVPAPAGPA
jgi:signal transduction histidine kinase